MFQSPPDKRTPKGYKALDEDGRKILESKVCGKKRLQTELESESEDSPPKQAREGTAQLLEAGGKASWSTPHIAGRGGLGSRVTSTPAGPLRTSGGSATIPIFHTPSPMRTPAHDDMSPITMSAQRMPKAMQVMGDMPWVWIVGAFR